MRFHWLIPIGFVAVAISAQTVDNPTGITIFSTSTLTNVYTASTAVDVQSWDSVSVIASTVTTQNVAVANIKPQWSHDNSTWVDVGVLTAGSIANLETPYTLSSKQITVVMSNGNPSYVELYPRNARYFRLLVKSTNVFTTGTLNITVNKLNNNTSSPR